jgi:hypothetical protein
MFFFRSFKISFLTFVSLIHFELIFAQDEIRVHIQSYTCGYPVFLTPFLKSLSLPHHYGFGAIVINKMSVTVWDFLLDPLFYLIGLQV